MLVSLAIAIAAATTDAVEDAVVAEFEATEAAVARATGDGELVVVSAGSDTTAPRSPLWYGCSSWFSG